MKDNIILIGMPASGKSTVGVILAKILGYDFIDSDLVIQKATGKKLRELIGERGAAGFIALEEEINRGICAEKTVIATGGSAVYGSCAMRHFKEIGKVVYLEIAPDDWLKRIDDVRQRGVVLKDGQSLMELYRERCGLYQKYADLIIHTTGKTAEDVIREIIGIAQKK